MVRPREPSWWVGQPAPAATQHLMDMDESTSGGGGAGGGGAQPLPIDDEPVTPGARSEPAKPSDVNVDVGPTMQRWAVLGAFCSLSCFNSMM